MNSRIRFFTDRVFQASIALGSVFLLLVGSGIVDAQSVPPFQCTGANKAGCDATGCIASQGVCNNLNWTKQQRLSYDYRGCEGASGTCAGFSTETLTCKNLFFDADHPNCPVNAVQCTISSSIGGCPPG